MTLSLVCSRNEKHTTYAEILRLLRLFRKDCACNRGKRLSNNDWRMTSVFGGVQIHMPHRQLQIIIDILD